MKEVFVFGKRHLILISVINKILCCCLTCGQRSPEGLMIHVDSQFILILGFNIYAPAVRKTSNGRIMYFGGWLTEAQKPNDAIYQCNLLDDGCTNPRLVLTHDQITGLTRHVNDPSVDCDQRDYSCTFAATICINDCKSQSDNQIWLGTNFGKLKEIVGYGAAEPALGRLPVSDVPVVFYTRRGVPGNVYAMRYDRRSFQGIGSEEILIIDRNFAVSGITFASGYEICLLAWNRFIPRAGGHLNSDLEAVSVAYSIYDYAIGQWSKPRQLIYPGGDVCAYLTPDLSLIDKSHFELHVGIIKRDIFRNCELTNWSKSIETLKGEIVP